MSTNRGKYPTVVEAVINNVPANRAAARQWCDENYNEDQFINRLIEWIRIATNNPLLC